MNKYIVKLISTVDSSLKMEIEINDAFLFAHDRYYEFIGEDKCTIACFPIDRVIIFRIKH